MVSNDEIKRMLDAKRSGVDTKKHDEKSINNKICSYCRFKNPEKAIFCVKCGKKLEKNVNIKCNSCGANNPKTAKFCVECGNDLTRQDHETNLNTVKNLDIKTEKSPIVQNNEDQRITNENLSHQLSDEPAAPEFETVPDNSNMSDELNPSKDDSELIKPEVVDKEVIQHVNNRGLPSSIPDHDLIKPKDSRKTCPSCNGKNLKNAKFCVVCGEKFSEPQTTLKSNPEPDLKTESFIKGSESPEIDDPIEKIKKAKELMDMGAITSEEFETIKRKYLDMI